ncbi:MAG: peptidoglycan-associated lipoprotein Pal [Alphaproteobacteria bacterium]|jgi:peptidoglycan-associated lipoprotein|nr:peptidoglycan-associated lipoprotein [alpha proteobacterium HIMB59]|tara:strand:+ start:105 stop:599 length:495 start_codon:yes stop_codon:yes gene_type:complete
MLKKLLLLVVTGFFLASCAATNTQQGGDVDAASSSTSSGSDSSITAGTQEDLIVNVGDRVFFEFDSSELTVDAQATLDAQAAWLMQYPDTNITIEGHADERGTREYNLALGDKRAFAVYSYLAQAGIDTNRMEYISWGKERPEVVGSDETAYSQNRRGVTTVTN